MPKALEQKLKRKAASEPGWSKERENAYVYGTLRNTGWKPERERRARQHREDNGG
jgi:hypothetical protein